MMETELVLNKANRIKLARAFKNVKRVDCSIDCVVEGQMGKVFVDDPNEPRVFRIQVGPFCYFAGDPENPTGQEMLKKLQPYCLMMPSGSGWAEAAKEIHGKFLISMPRYSYSFGSVKSDLLKEINQQGTFKDDTNRMDLKFVSKLWGVDHFIDLADFDSPEDFVTRGIGFYIEKSGEVIAAAFSSLVCSHSIEVSIFVLDSYRRQGAATVLGSKLLQWCLDNGMEAHWDAANRESCKLAEKFGYSFKSQYDAFYIPDLSGRNSE